MNTAKGRHIYLLLIYTGFVIGIIMIFFTACNSDKKMQGEWVYVSEFIPVDKENFYFENARVFGDNIYSLSQSVYRYSVEDRQFITVLFNWQIERTDRTIEDFFVSGDGSIYLVVKENAGRQILYKFDNQGEQIFSQDITNQIGDGLNGIEVDAKGRIYIGNGTKVWLYDETGEEHGCIYLDKTNAGIVNMGSNRRGSMYVGYYESSARGFFDLGNLSLAELDFDNRKVIASCSDLSLGNGNNLIPGIEENFLVYDNIGVYDYGMEIQTKSLVFEWLECNIDGAFVDSVDKLPDAIANLNNDLASSDCPDIIDLSELNIEQLAAADVLEDMTPYLKDSSMLCQTDFLENILAEYTIEGKLVTIPYKFTICTVIGSSEKIGDKSGWTIDEIMDFANAYPESELFGKFEKREILQYLMMLDEDTFINWQTGECNFDSEQFKELLQFVYGLPDAAEQNPSVFSGPPIDVDEQDRKTFPNPVRIQKGEVLLDIEYIFNFDTIQMCKEMFQDDVACIGFPTLDGTGGHIFYPLQIYGITTKSNCKEGAWKFMESLLLQGENGYSNEYGFPTRKVELEAMISRTLNFDYLLNEYGELLLDEEGKPIEDPEQLPTSVSNDGWLYTYRRTTREEIDIMLAVLAKAKRISGGSNNIMQIIGEEVDGYFTGQKTLDDVVNIIQSRVGIYIDENR